MKKEVVVVPSVEVIVIFALPMSAQHPNIPRILEKIIPMARKSSSKKTASTNGDARTTNGNHIASKKNSTSALQTSSASVSNASQAKAQHPSPVTDTTFYASVSEDTIRQRAYELYMQRGGQDGGHVEDWFRAEAEVRGRH